MEGRQIMHNQTNVRSWWGGRKLKLNKEFVYIALGIILLAVICYLHALSEGHYADFYPINGTFQNYNPVRRFLDGQIPYRDFSDYLGMGHLYIGTLATLLFGGTYQSSLVAFSFLTFAGFQVLSLVLGRAIFGDIKKSINVSLFFSVIVLVKPLFLSNSWVSFQEIQYALNNALSPLNSARFVRGTILPLTIVMMLLLHKIYIAKKDCLNVIIARILPAIITGMVAGGAFIWSNDYGISTWLCLVIMYIYVSFVRNKKAKTLLCDTLLLLVGSAVSIFIFVEVFTWGNFNNWVATTLGTGGYQSWYYNSPKSYFLYDVDFSFVMLIQALVTIVYLYKLFREQGKIAAVIRYGIPAFINMTCFCAVNEYKLLSGGGSREVALSALFITIVYEFFAVIEEYIYNTRLEKKCTTVVLVICFAWILSTAKDEFVFAYATEKDGEYIESMGGNMTGLYLDMKVAHDFLEGNEFFATYASGQEVYENTFQPTGTDYIIHVLGDEQRKQYLDKFSNGDFKYAVTIRKDFTDWEYWVERANWFFYRKLYRDWHPVFSNLYETYWARNEMENQNIVSDKFEVCAEYVDDTTIKLIIDTDENISGIADVYIDYQIETRAGCRLAKLQFLNILKVQNIVINASDIDYESNFLRPISKEFVPMTIQNGHGELVLTSTPDRTTMLKLNEATCTDIYTVQRD